MIDIDTHRIIDMIKSRDAKDVSEWLSTYPNLTIVSRDGSITYANAIKQAVPKALQISDRFHLLKNLTDYCKSYLKKILKPKIQILKNTDNNTNYTCINKSKYEKIINIKKLKKEGYSVSKISTFLKMDIKTVEKYSLIQDDNLDNETKTKDEIKHEEKIIQKREKIDEVCKLHKAGYSMRKISEITGYHRSTVKKYLDPNVSTIHEMYGVTKEGILSPYHKKINELLYKGMTLKEIEKILIAKGYKGSSSNIRMYASKQRKIMKEAFSNNKKEKFELIDRSHFIKLLYKPLEKVKKLTQLQFDKVIKDNPILGKIYETIKTFKEILKVKDESLLETWIIRVKNLNINELNSFCNGLLRDLDAVKNAIKYKYNNGLAEGSVNKIKVIKRIMYGRCSFKTLRRKVIMLEKRKTTN